MKTALKYFFTIGLSLGVGYASSFATQSSIKTWYPTLVKPFFNPPNYVFAPVWTVLFILMGIAMGMVWNTPNVSKENLKKAWIIFSTQLILNAAWSILFFGLNNILLALIEIVLLWFIILENIKIFQGINPKAGKLLYPYLAWVSYAFLLNAAIFWLN
jgi:benzodiazapine receptor